jgi:beta-phosphoglucomutase
MLANIKLVIFDLDGVLVDACEWHRLALNDALKEVCNYEISLEDHYKEFNGTPTKIKLQKLVDKKIIDTKHVDLIEKIKQEKTIELIKSLAYIREEKIELLTFLQRNKIKLGCYTNSIRTTAELMLEKTGIHQFFDLLITNQDVKTPKPNPEGYIHCMQHFKVNPLECIIVEDSPKGIEAAKSSGARVFIVNNPNNVTKKEFLTRIKNI